MKSSVEFTENVLEEKVKKLDGQCENMDAELQEFYNNQVDPQYSYNKLVDLEDRSRRCNLGMQCSYWKKRWNMGGVGKLN